MYIFTKSYSICKFIFPHFICTRIFLLSLTTFLPRVCCNTSQQVLAKITQPHLVRLYPNRALQTQNVHQIIVHTNSLVPMHQWFVVCLKNMHRYILEFKMDGPVTRVDFFALISHWVLYVVQAMTFASAVPVWVESVNLPRLLTTNSATIATIVFLDHALTNSSGQVLRWFAVPLESKET